MEVQQNPHSSQHKPSDAQPETIEVLVQVQSQPKPATNQSSQPQPLVTQPEEEDYDVRSFLSNPPQLQTGDEPSICVSSQLDNVGSIEAHRREDLRNCEDSEGNIVIVQETDEFNFSDGFEDDFIIELINEEEADNIINDTRTNLKVQSVSETGDMWCSSILTMIMQSLPSLTMKRTILNLWRTFLQAAATFS